MTEDLPVLWRHKDPQSTQLWAFKSLIEQKHAVQFDDYEALRQWSIANLDAFWAEVWRFTGVRASKPFTEVCGASCGRFMMLPKES